MSLVVTGRVTMTSTAYLCVALFSWFLKPIVPSFQFENPRVTFNKDSNAKIHLAICSKEHNLKAKNLIRII